MLEMPMVLKKPHEKGFKIVDFDFHFDCATVSSVPANFCINSGFLPGLEPTAQSDIGINHMNFGAFYLQAHFTAKKANY